MVCVNERWILVETGKGSIALLVYTVVCYSYAVTMLIVYYFIPKSEGLVQDILTPFGDDLLNRGTDTSDFITKSV